MNKNYNDIDQQAEREGNAIKNRFTGSTVYFDKRLRKTAKRHCSCGCGMLRGKPIRPK